MGVFGYLFYEAVDLKYESSERNYKRGLQAALLVLVIEGTLRNYKGPFLRPNEAVWRGVARFCLI